MESDKIDIGLGRLRRRRCTKAAIPIVANTAAIPPMTPPTIAGVFDFVCVVDFFFATVPLGLMSSTGALREGSSQP
jgi:hypothetical protein